MAVRHKEYWGRYHKSGGLTKRLGVEFSDGEFKREGSALAFFALDVDRDIVMVENKANNRQPDA